jgi:hypothetical protein
MIENERTQFEMHFFEEEILRKFGELEIKKNASNFSSSKLKYEGEIEKLSSKIVQTSNELSVKGKEKEYLERELNDIRLQSKELAKSLQATEQNRINLEKILDERELTDGKQLVKVEKQISLLEIEIKKLQNQLQLSKQNETNLKDSIEKLERETGKNGRERMEMEKELWNLRKENSLLVAKLELASSNSISSQKSVNEKIFEFGEDLVEKSTKINKQPERKNQNLIIVTPKKEKKLIPIEVIDKKRVTKKKNVIEFEETDKNEKIDNLQSKPKVSLRKNNKSLINENKTKDKKETSEKD